MTGLDARRARLANAKKQDLLQEAKRKGLPPPKTAAQRMEERLAERMPSKFGGAAEQLG